MSRFDTKEGGAEDDVPSWKAKREGSSTANALLGIKEDIAGRLGVVAVPFVFMKALRAWLKHTRVYTLKSQRMHRATSHSVVRAPQVKQQLARPRSP